MNIKDTVVQKRKRMMLNDYIQPRRGDILVAPDFNPGEIEKRVSRTPEGFND